MLSRSERLSNAQAFGWVQFPVSEPCKTKIVRDGEALVSFVSFRVGGTCCGWTFARGGGGECLRVCCQRRRRML